MPTRNVYLTPELDAFVATKIQSGLYDSANEVICAGLRALEQDEKEFEARLAVIRSAIDAGDACDPANDMDGETSSAEMEQFMDELVAGKEFEG